ncbi:MAG: glycosyltransferase family 2 protein [Lachnospiraceae bacterium]|nr:glycosyltransferase family 2 protein [Lachnospiraceae bacterium]
MSNSTIDVIIPTCKPNREFGELIDRLQKQTIPPNKIILMNTQEELIQPFLRESRILERYDNIEIHHVKREEFDHGKTRHVGVQFSQAEFFLCMTQDALPADRYLVEELLKALQEEKVAAAYARQIPRKDSTILEEYTRGFNYPDKSRIKYASDLKELGIKTFFCSNVCAAYKREIYDRQGGFIQKTIFNEDMIFAGGLIQAGYGVAYRAEARVIHSHHYTGRQQLCRNFDLGVSQADHPEIFGAVTSEKEGQKLVGEMLSYLAKQKKLIWMLPFIYETGCKLLGYRLGKAYKKLPKALILRCSMNRNYWKS